MEPEFWQERWKQNQIAFHQNEINFYLKDLWPEMKLPPGTGVLVPMCGKSLDMIWLAEQDYRVIGVELSEIAAKEFCAENKLSGNHSKIASGELYQFGPKLSFICGDFFNVIPEDLGKIGGVYDRASLVALPPQMRKKYAQHMTSLVAPGAKVFTITFEYNQSKMQGPPFAVHPEEVMELYENQFDIKEIHYQKSIAAMPRLAGEMLGERVYILTKKE